MKRLLKFIPLILVLTIVRCYASANGSEVSITNLLLQLLLILIGAKIGGEIFVRLGQPAVLGELIFGIIAGNMKLLGVSLFDSISTDSSINILSEIGIMLLLFQVGLQSDVGKMAKVGVSSFLTATLGVIAPFFLGWGASKLFFPNESIFIHIFIGAALCATSVGLTARVLFDLGKLNTTEARIILGAAVIDDVQGLIILAVVQGIISAVNSGGTMSMMSIILITAKAFIFLFGALVLGRKMAGVALRFAFRLKTTDLLLITSLVICFGFAEIAALIGLAPIVGAFAAGLILDEVHWRSFAQRGELSVEELIRPIAAFLVPIFFVRMGAIVDLSSFANTQVLLFAGALTLAAIIGKQVCGLGVIEKGVDRLSIGFGMIPRGEVGLIFAGIGSQLVINGEKVISNQAFSSIVFMVVVTTMITPPLLKWGLSRKKQI